MPLGSAVPGHDAGRRRLLVLILAGTLLGLGHHLDHLVRGNHLGWPVTAEVSPFTYSLVVYPLIGLGLYLWTRRAVGPGYWALLAAGGLLFVGLTHLGPSAAEPPQDIIGAYASPAAGWAAFGLLLVFLGTLAALALYAARLWRRDWAQRAGDATPNPGTR
jgi:hypothetical protein